MKYQFLIVDTYDATVKGTNDRQKALEFSEFEDYFVIDVTNCNWLSNKAVEKVEELTEDAPDVAEEHDEAVNPG